MDITRIMALSLCALVVGWVVPQKRLVSALLLVSLFSLYWLQTSTLIRNLDFWFPTASIALTLLTWAITAPADRRSFHQALTGVLVILVFPIGIGLSRYLKPICCLTPSQPPQIHLILVVCAVIIAIFLGGFFLFSNKRFPTWIMVCLILGLFIFLKSAPLTRILSTWLRYASGQSTELASAVNLPWLGFSFLAFRLLHVLRDYQTKRLPVYSFGEFAAYALFFPTVVSGPIDRSQHLIEELQQIQKTKREANWKDLALQNSLVGLERILIGGFKKFVLADSLAIFALNSQNSSQTNSLFWMWVLLFAYSLRIYFDFAGYTDIAIGMARLVGIHLPENFDRPYLKQNLTAFWNSWHITLSLWFRSYVFYPFTRAMRTSRQPLPTWLTIFAGQFVTMSLIGLWHGISWNFFLWGAWHGLGLFIQNRWSDWIRGHLDASTLHKTSRLALQGSGWLLTFLFVSLGWVWFALPTPQLAISVFSKLAGLGQ